MSNSKIHLIYELCGRIQFYDWPCIVSVHQTIVTRRVYVSGSLNDHFLCHRDAVPKQCCGLSSPPVRWSILGVGFVGLVCAGAGTLLGALKASGRDHLVGIFMSGKETHFSYSRSSICEVVIRRYNILVIKSNETNLIKKKNYNLYVCDYAIKKCYFIHNAFFLSV